MMEASENELRVVGQYRGSGRDVRLRSDAAGALEQLIARARAQGVKVIPISGFRTFAYQAGLFQKALSKYASEDEAARWVGRPGHSEHHTGLAVDLGDGDSPESDVEPAFEQTRAFQWLQQNAAQFGFELSFPPGNLRGVHYEPWHWRFVGTTAAKEVFKQ